MIKILLVDDHPIVADGIKGVLESVNNISVIGNATNGKDAFKMVLDLKPDIVLADINMPIINGLELTKMIVNAKLDTKVIILSMHEDEKYINMAMEYGACGYILKDCEKLEITDSITKVMEGEKYFSKTASQIIVNNLFNKDTSDEPFKYQNEISKREKEVIRMLAKGKNNKEIAEFLNVSTRTVDTHRYNVMQKLNVKNTAELIANAIKYKVIEFD